MRETSGTSRSLAAGIAIFAIASSHAEVVQVDTPSTVINFGSVVLGDYQIVTSGGPGNLVDGSPDFAVVSENLNGSLVLSRVDGMPFDLNSVFVRGTFSSSIGGVIINPTFGDFEEYQVNVSDVTSVTMTPFGTVPPSVAALQLAAFDVDQPNFNDAGPGHWAFSFINILAAANITAGCGNNNFCPDDPVTRAQMAVFLVRGMYGADFVPPPATGTVFLDVGAGDFAAGFIEQLRSDGITGGCGNGNYCPNSPVTRAQMAVFLLRARYGPSYVPPPASGLFADVPVGSFGAAWIEQLAAEGITSGCGNGNYCPNAPVTRAQMAVFLVRVFNEPPVFVSSTTARVRENLAGPAYTAVTTDWTDVSYSIVGGVDADRFMIDAVSGELSFVSPPDFENPADENADNEYLVELGATDDASLASTLSIQITVDDVSRIETSVVYPTAFANIGGDQGGSVVTGRMVDAEDGVIEPGDVASIVVNGVTASVMLPDRWSAAGVPVSASPGLEVLATSQSGDQTQLLRDVRNAPHIACLGSFTRDSTGTLLYGVDVYLKSLVEIDYPGGASWRLVSDPDRGSGTSWLGPSGVIIEPGDQTAIVADESGGTIFRVDIASGNRTVVSGPSVGTGTPLQFPSDVAFSLGGASVLVPDFAADAVIDVNLADGSRTVLYDENVGTGIPIDGPGTITIDSLANRAIVTSQIMSGVYAIDLTTGNRQVVSDNSQGSGVEILLPYDLVLDSTGQTAYMADIFNPNVIFRIDMATGDRVTVGPPNFGPSALLLDEARDWLVVGDCTHREVVAYRPSDGSRLQGLISTDPGFGILRRFLGGIAYDSSQDRILLTVTNAEGTVSAIHPEQGFTTRFSSALDNRGSGPQLDSTVSDPEIDLSNNRVLLVSSLGLIAIDLDSADRTIISGAATGSGPFFAGPVALAHDPAADIAYVLDFDGTLYEVDLGTGNRTIISSSSVGTGPEFQRPRDMDIDVAGNRVIVVDRDQAALVAVDLASGDRSILSASGTGTGAGFRVPEGIAIDSTNSRALVTNRMTDQNSLGPGVTEAGIVAVDLATGNRSPLNSGRPYPVGVIDISIDADGGRIFLLDALLRMILVVDTDSGETAIVELPLGTVL